jgi:hypothetical protein
VIQNEKTMSNTNVLTEKESFVYVDGFNFTSGMKDADLIIVNGFQFFRGINQIKF